MKKQVPIEEIGFLIIDNAQCTISKNALQLLIENNSSVIFCNEKHMPISLLLPLDAHHIQSDRFKIQWAVGKALKKRLWKIVIEQKLKNQALLLAKLSLIHISEPTRPY